MRPVYAEGNAEGQWLNTNLEIKDIFGQVYNGDDTWNIAFDIIRVLIAGITGILSIAMVGVFAFKAFNLAKSGDNPQERQKAVSGIIYSFIGFALLGATSLLTGLFYNLLK